MNYYNLNNIPKHIDYPDIYFTPEYGKACEISDNATWELCQYKDLIYVYLKRPFVFEGTTYYDLITPYGYSGYYYENEETYKEFIQLFRKRGKERNYVTEVLRQNPYLNINITEYDIITAKSIFAIETSNFDYYFKNILTGKKRNMYSKALKNNLSFELIKMEKDLLKTDFINLYIDNMKKVNASQYYYFNDEYFNSIENINNSFLAVVKNNSDKIIGAAIIYVYGNNIHYHLSCNDNSSNCITDFLLINVIEKLCINKIFILGCGLSQGDSLSKFKEKLSNKNYEYTIYKNILNHEIYNEICSKTLIKNEKYFPKYRND